MNKKSVKTLVKTTVGLYIFISILYCSNNTGASFSITFKPKPIQKLSISGYVVDKNSLPIKCVKITLVFDTTQQVQITDDDGYYCFTNLEFGKSYTLIPLKTGWKFEPVSYSTTTLQSNIIDYNFIGVSEEKIIIELMNPPSEEFPEGKTYLEFSLPKEGDIKITSSDYEQLKWINQRKNEKVYVMFKGSGPGEYILRVYNLMGEVVYGPEVKNFSSSSGYFEWEPKNIPSGTYIIHIQGPGVNKYKKVVILR